jgi:hypothetical protein
MFPITNNEQREAYRLAHTMGIPVDAGLWLVKLQKRVAELEENFAALEKKVAALQGPPHLQEVEKRA